MRHGSLTFTIHYFVTQIKMEAIQPLQHQNQSKSTYHTKSSRSNIKFQASSRQAETGNRELCIYLVSFSSYSKLLVKCHQLEPTHLHLAPLYGMIPFKFCQVLLHKKL